MTNGLLPPDGNSIISDGDLLGIDCVFCARNQDLLEDFHVEQDLGLDAVDLINVYDEEYWIAFSTELDSPNLGQFTAGDLLVTNGAIIPNAALLSAFQLPQQDLGLDAVHFVGDPKMILEFLDFAQSVAPELMEVEWATGGRLQDLLKEYEIDIWFSTEGTAKSYLGQPGFLDGDLLSARDGIIVQPNSGLLPAGVPAGIPSLGVDFGLDAVTAHRLPMSARVTIYFSTELLHSGQPQFNDGDVLRIRSGVAYRNKDLIHCLEPIVDFLGLDALFIEAP